MLCPHPPCHTLKDVRHKKEMQAQLTGLLEWQLDAKDEAVARAAAEQRHEAETIKAAWHREEAAAAAAAQEQLARQRVDNTALLEANRWVLALQAAGGRMACMIRGQAYGVPACLPFSSLPACPKSANCPATTL